MMVLSSARRAKHELCGSAQISAPQEARVRHAREATPDRLQPRAARG